MLCSIDHQYIYYEPLRQVKKTGIISMMMRVDGSDAIRDYTYVVVMYKNNNKERNAMRQLSVFKFKVDSYLCNIKKCFCC